MAPLQFGAAQRMKIGSAMTPIPNRIAYQDCRAEGFVEACRARGDIHRITYPGILPGLLTTHIPPNRRTAMNAEARAKFRQTAALLLAVEFLDLILEFK